MAAPSEITCKNLTGKYVMNKTLSDDSDVVLKTQGISWFTRKAISIATVTLSITETQDANSNYCIDILSNASGLSETHENRVLDWEKRPHNDKIFGNVEGKSRLVTGSNVEAQTPELSLDDIEFLKGAVLKDGKTKSELLEQDSVHSFVKNVDSGYEWTAEQIWNFEMVDGVRRHSRRVVVRNKKGDTIVRARLVYDYLGPVAGGSNGTAQ